MRITRLCTSTHQIYSSLFHARCALPQSRRVLDPNSRTCIYLSAFLRDCVLSYSPVEEHSAGVKFIHQLQKSIFGFRIHCSVSPYRGCQAIWRVVHEAHGLFITRNLTHDVITSYPRDQWAYLLDSDNGSECFCLMNFVSPSWPFYLLLPRTNMTSIAVSHVSVQHDK
jgi:hypothetical protein